MHYSLTRATIWNIAGYTYLIIASLFSTPILVSSLGITQFGQYSLIIASLALVSSLDLGLPQAVIRALSRSSSTTARRTLWATSSLLFLGTGLGSALIVTVVCYFLRVKITVLPIVFGIALLNNLVAHYSTLPQAEGHFGYFNTKTFFVGTANTLIAAYLAYMGWGVTAILGAQLFAYLFTLLPLAYFSLKFFPHPRDGQGSLVVARPLITFGLKNQLGKIAGQLHAQYAKYLLAAISPIRFSAYIIASGLVAKLTGGITQLATALYPRSSRTADSPELLRLYYRLQLSLLILGLLGILIYHAIGLQFLTWWLHNLELAKTVDRVMSILVYYLALLILTPIPSTVLDSLGYPGTTSFLGGAAFALELTIAIFLLPIYGYLAPAYAGVVSLVIMVPVLVTTTLRRLQHHQR